MTDVTSKNPTLWFFISLFLVSSALLGWLLWPFFSIIVIAAVVTGVFRPVYNRLSTVKGVMSAPFASFLTCALIFLVLFVPIALLVGILSKEAYDLYQAARDAVLGEKIQSLLEGNIWIEKIKLFFSRFNIEISGEELKSMVTQTAKVVGLFLYEQARAIASNMFAFIINFILMLLVIFYLLIDGDRLVEFIVELSPLPREQNDELVQRFKDIAGAVLIGNGLAGLIQGVIGGAVFAFFNFNSPILWGVIMGILAFLPILGIGLVLIPTAVYLFLTSNIAAGIFMMIFYILLSGGVEYIFKPRLVGHRVKMHVLLVFFSIIGGLKLFGMLGIIYGPLIVTGFLTLAGIYHASYQSYLESAENINVPPCADF